MHGAAGVNGAAQSASWTVLRAILRVRYCAAAEAAHKELRPLCKQHSGVKLLGDQHAIPQDACLRPTQDSRTVLLSQFFKTQVLESGAACAS